MKKCDTIYPSKISEDNEMITTQLIEEIKLGKLDERLCDIYGNQALNTQKKRYTEAIMQFEKIYGQRDVSLFSVPGRSEVSGNHTDHENGCVLACGISLDIIAVAAKTDDECITVQSKGFSPDTCYLNDLQSGRGEGMKYSSASLICGVCDGFLSNGYQIGSFCAYTTSNVLKGSGLSSSAAFEDMIGNILSHFYNDGCVSPVDIAKISRYAENEFFGKPCGLMDQAACACGSFVYMDFEKPDPIVEPIKFDLSHYGYEMCIVNTGGNHADLSPEYASVTYEMKKIASHFGKAALREVNEADFFESISTLREKYGDRCVLRAYHFYTEQKRVEKQRQALLDGDIDRFLALMNESGNSSYKYLQNVYVAGCPNEQGLSLALALSESILEGKPHAVRVHGGGFAGTIQCILKQEDTQNYVERMEKVFGKDSCHILGVRKYGAIKL